MITRSRFLKFFPPPKFLVMPAACVAVSDETLRFVDLKKGRRSIELKNYTEKKLPKETISAGEVRNSKALLSALKEMKNDFGTRYVSLSLPEEKGYIYTTQVPTDEEGVTEEQVAFTLEKNIPFAVDEVVFDYVETGEKSKTGSEVVVMALPNTVVRGYVDVLEQVGLTPLYFEIESYSLSRAVINLDDPRTHLLVHIQKDTTNISIISRNIPRFTSTVHSGSDLGTADTLRQVASWLKEEIGRVKSYWQSHGSRSAGVPQTVVLCGEMMGQGSEKDVIASGLDVEVNIANVWENVTNFDDYVPDIPHSKSLKYGTAIGLAIREFKRIN